MPGRIISIFREDPAFMTRGKGGGFVHLPALHSNYKPVRIMTKIFEMTPEGFQLLQMNNKTLASTTEGRLADYYKRMYNSACEEREALRKRVMQLEMREMISAAEEDNAA